MCTILLIKCISTVLNFDFMKFVVDLGRTFVFSNNNRTLQKRLHIFQESCTLVCSFNMYKCQKKKKKTTKHVVQLFMLSTFLLSFEESTNTFFGVAVSLKLCIIYQDQRGSLNSLGRFCFLNKCQDTFECGLSKTYS